MELAAILVIRLAVRIFFLYGKWKARIESFSSRRGTGGVVGGARRPSHWIAAPAATVTRGYGQKVDGRWLRFSSPNGERTGKRRGFVNSMEGTALVVEAFESRVQRRTSHSELSRQMGHARSFLVKVLGHPPGAADR